MIAEFPIGSYPLRTIHEHFFVELNGSLWLLDTGAPQSFGAVDQLEISGRRFALPGDFMGMDADQLSEYVAVECCGLLGADIWGRFDLVINQLEEKIHFVVEDVTVDSQSQSIKTMMGIPILEVEVGGSPLSLFLDTGAKITYLAREILADFPVMGKVEDFYHGFGQFETDIHEVPIRVSDEATLVTAGSLPDALSPALMLPGIDGILGNEVFMHREVVLSARRNLMWFASRSSHG